MKKLILYSLLILLSFNVHALNVTIIDSRTFNSGQVMDTLWKTLCIKMGHTATIYPATQLDLLSNLSSTDILIVSSGVDPALTVARTNIIQQYLQNGGKVYIQSEYLSSFAGNIAYQSLVNALGGYFNWTGVISGTLAPMNILGSMATDYAVTSPLPYFWYGQSIDPCSSVEMFLEYGGNYFGSTFCVPTSAGRLITTSDQDWVNQANSYPAIDSLMKNIIYNLAKPSYNCANSGGLISAKLGNDTTLCSGNSIVLSPGAGFSTYLWTGGQTTASITVNIAGTYWVKVSSPCGSTASDTINVAIQPCNLPIAALSSSDSGICVNACIGFTDLSTNNPTSWLWTFYGAVPATSTDQNPPFVCYLDKGDFDVKLVATNSNGSDSLTFSNFIHVFDAPPTPTITMSHDTLFCSFDSTDDFYQWYSDTTLIVGATDFFLVINHDANYNLDISNMNGCSIAVGITITGIKDPVEDNFISTYPNPAGKELTINVPQTGKDMQFEIYNTLGEKVLPSQHYQPGKELIINVENLPKGIYFIRGTSQNNSWISRFIKE